MRTIERFMNWLKSQKFWKVLLLAWGTTLVWKFLVALLFHSLGWEFSQGVYKDNPDVSNSLIESCLIAPFSEEPLFRWIPMLLLSFVMMWLYKTSRIDKDQFFKVEKYAILILTVVSSIVFGWVHGNFLNVFIQGVSGVVLMLVYLRIYFIRRDKGLRNRWQVVSLAEAILLHALSNII